MAPSGVPVASAVTIAARLSAGDVRSTAPTCGRVATGSSAPKASASMAPAAAGRAMPARAAAAMMRLREYRQRRRQERCLVNLDAIAKRALDLKKEGATPNAYPRISKRPCCPAGDRSRVWDGARRPGRHLPHQGRC